MLSLIQPLGACMPNIGSFGVPFGQGYGYGSKIDLTSYIWRKPVFIPRQNSASAGQAKGASDIMLRNENSGQQYLERDPMQTKKKQLYLKK